LLPTHLQYPCTLSSSFIAVVPVSTCLFVPQLFTLFLINAGSMTYSIDSVDLDEEPKGRSSRGRTNLLRPLLSSRSRESTSGEERRRALLMGGHYQRTYFVWRGLWFRPKDNRLRAPMPFEQRSKKRYLYRIFEAPCLTRARSLVLRLRATVRQAIFSIILDAAYYG